MKNSEKQIKAIAFYLPQFHTIPENDKWWGRGFTEWVNIKKAKPLYKNHYQPRVPYNDNYYNLLDDDTIRWQINLAKLFNVYGFCFYHYWFDGHMLLEKPMEIMLNNPELNMPYCVCWANENWTNAWKADGNIKTLIQQTYGYKDEWKRHFDYLLQFFKDPNYIKINSKPMFVIYRPEIIPCLAPMMKLWNQLAIENGFAGISFAYQQLTYHTTESCDESLFDFNIEYQPTYARYDIRINKKDSSARFAFKIRNDIRKVTNSIDKLVHTNLSAHLSHNKLSKENYKELCNAIINRSADSHKAIGGMFVGWDNTPRRGIKGSICEGSSPELFGYYLKRQIENIKKNYSTDMIFIFAWNEWAEGGYLEPDEKYRYAYLEELRKSLQEQ